MFVHYYMTPAPMTISPEHTVADAIEIIGNHSFRHLPVVDEQGVLQGMVTDRDLRSANPSTVARSKERLDVENRVHNTPVSVVMSTDCLFLTRLSTLDRALLLFQTKKVGALPVVDDEEKVIGIFSVMDLMKAYRLLFGLGEKGSALISIEDNGSPQALSKLVQILEEHQVQFTRLIRAEGSEAGQTMIYLRINTYNIRSVHKVLEGAGFTIHIPVLPH